MRRYNADNPLIGTNFTLGIPLKDRGINLQRYPNAPYPHRTDLCFYHQAFGKDALKCNVGCAWVDKTGKPPRQVPVRKPNTNLSPPHSTPSNVATTSSTVPKNA